MSRPPYEWIDTEAGGLLRPELITPLGSLPWTEPEPKPAQSAFRTVN